MLIKQRIILCTIRKGIVINFIIVLLQVSSTSVSANSISSGSPWSLELDCRITIESIPYNPYGVGIGLGITRVFRKTKLLYLIEGYSSNTCIANKTGEYLAFIFPWVTQEDLNSRKNNEKESGNPDRNEGEIIKIFKGGKFLKSFYFQDLNIDTSMLAREGELFYWKSINEKITHFPAYFEQNILRIATVDNQIVKLELTDVVKYSTEILSAEDLDDFADRISSRKIKSIEIDYPDLNAFPKLSSGQTIETGFSEILDVNVTKNADSAILWVRVDVLLINKEGRCELCYVSTNEREDMLEPYEYPFNNELGEKIEEWLYQQSYDTKLIPELMGKYAFSSRGPICFKRKSG